MPEREEERLDRELIELLNELRVALPGVQVLFAFLLTVPFSQRFTTLGSSERREYFLAILLTALSSAFLIAPSAQHRMRLHLITTILYDATVAAMVAGLLTGGTALLWFVLPRFFPED